MSNIIEYQRHNSTDPQYLFFPQEQIAWFSYL